MGCIVCCEVNMGEEGKDGEDTPAPEFTTKIDMAAETSGGKILFATDDWFATAENLLKVEAPVWKEGEFTEFGKWMDGWETRRKRIPGHDWCIIQLGAGGVLSGVEVDTSFFTGNYAPRISIQGAALTSDFPPRPPREMGTAATTKELEDIQKLKSENWKEIVPRTDMGAGYKTSCHNFIKVDCKDRLTHIRFNIFPDGGVSRLHVYGTVQKDWSTISETQLVDLVSMKNGGTCIDNSDAHYGHARNIINPGRAKIMAEGWETARRLDRPPILKADDKGIIKFKGQEWAEFKLGHPGIIQQIELDTNHFKGNFPDSCFIEGCYSVEKLNFPNKNWKTLLPVQKMSAHKRHFYSGETVQKIGVISHVCITMAPDGGISRMRLLGYKHKPPTPKL